MQAYMYDRRNPQAHKGSYFRLGEVAVEGLVVWM